MTPVRLRNCSEADGASGKGMPEMVTYLYHDASKTGGGVGWDYRRYASKANRAVRQRSLLSEFANIKH